MTTTPTALTISCQSDLEDAWRVLMGDDGFSHASIWALILDADGHPCANLTEIAEPPSQPHAEDAAPVVRLLAEVAAAVAGEGARLAFLLSRPGPARVSESDRLWAARLLQAGVAHGARLEVIHLATARDVRPIPMDDLVE